MFSLWILLGPAQAGSVTEKVAGGVVDWTEGIILAEASAVGGGGPKAWRETRAAEQEARTALAESLASVARSVRFTSDITVDSLLRAGDDLAELLEQNLASWEVPEARYFSSGKVELSGQLALSEWLRPALVGWARASDDVQVANGPTGLLVDARGLRVRPALAPRLLAPDGRTLYGLELLSALAAATATPAVWVDDPADARAAARSGPQPLVVVATAVQGGSDLVLSHEDVRRVDDQGSAILALGRVVVVVDP